MSPYSSHFKPLRSPCIFATSIQRGLIPHSSHFKPLRSPYPVYNVVLSHIVIILNRYEVHIQYIMWSYPT